MGGPAFAGLPRGSTRDSHKAVTQPVGALARSSRRLAATSPTSQQKTHRGDVSTVPSSLGPPGGPGPSPGRRVFGVDGFAAPTRQISRVPRRIIEVPLSGTILDKLVGVNGALVRRRPGGLIDTEPAGGALPGAENRGTNHAGTASPEGEAAVDAGVVSFGEGRFALSSPHLDVGIFFRFGVPSA